MEKKNFLGILMVVGVAVWSVWPMVQNPSRVANYGRDGELLVWILNSGITPKLFGDISGMETSIFDGNIYYPYKKVLAYSDMLMISGSWGWVAGFLAHNPGAVTGAVMIGSQVMVAIVVYEIWRRMTGSWAAAAVATAALILSQIRWHYQVHLQMWSMQYWLAGTYLVIEGWRGKRPTKLYWGAGLLGLQVWESLLPVYFAAVVVGMYWLMNWWREKGRDVRKRLFAAGVIFAVMAFLPLRAYWEVGREFNFQRSIREAAHNSIGVDELAGVFASPGLYILLGVAFLRMRKPQWDGRARWLAGVVLAGVIMAMGPVVKWQGKTVKAAGRWPIPLPYAAAYYLVPGFDAFRTPSRWLWISAWAGSGMVALTLARSGGKNWVAIAAAMAVAIGGGTRMTNYRDVPAPQQYPRVYQWLKTQPGGVVLTLPTGNENIETERMVYSLVHRKNLVNGFSGFAPPEREIFLARLNQEWPGAEMDMELRKLGVNYVIVDKEKFGPRAEEEKILWEDESYVVFRL